MIRRHAMPCGAAMAGDGGVDFRLWAPAAKRVDLSLIAGENRALTPMEPGDGGWHVVHCDAARVGALYQFVIDGDFTVPDPASRFQPRDVHGPSEVIDPAAFQWTDGAWRGRPWHETVLYELHLGTFSPQGTYTGAIAKLDHLA